MILALNIKKKVELFCAEKKKGSWKRDTTRFQRAAGERVGEENLSRGRDGRR